MGRPRRFSPEWRAHAARTRSWSGLAASVAGDRSSGRASPKSFYGWPIGPCSSYRPARFTRSPRGCRRPARRMPRTNGAGRVPAAHREAHARERENATGSCRSGAERADRRVAEHQTLAALSDGIDATRSRRMRQSRHPVPAYSCRRGLMPGTVTSTRTSPHPARIGHPVGCSTCAAGSGARTTLRASRARRPGSEEDRSRGPVASSPRAGRADGGSSGFMALSTRRQEVHTSAQRAHGARRPRAPCYAEP